jgi:hypothetical protein
MEQREWFKGLGPESRIAVLTQGRPPDQYVVRLEALVEGSWRTIHLFDNSHGKHDEHHYVDNAKQPAREFFVGAATQALPAAIDLLDSDWAAIIRRWKEKRT